MEQRAPRILDAGRDKLMEFWTFQDAWLAILRRLTTEGNLVSGVVDERSVGSSFGSGPRDFVEAVAVQARVLNPRARLFRAAHHPDLAFSIAQTIWTLSGSDNLEPIDFYSPRGREFSDNGRSLSAAPGARIFNSRTGDQFAAAMRLLSVDPSTRRAVIQLYLPEDTTERYRDASCIGSIQFLIRDSRLHSIVTMRSQSAARVFPYDSFLLSMLHELAAIELELALGDYRVFFGSLHYYLDERDRVNALLQTTDASPAAMPPMQSKLSRVLTQIVQAESAIRERLALDIRVPIDRDQFQLDTYWKDLLLVLLVSTRLRRGVVPSDDEIAALPDVYQDLLPSKRGPRTIRASRYSGR